MRSAVRWGGKKKLIHVRTEALNLPLLYANDLSLLNMLCRCKSAKRSANHDGMKTNLALQGRSAYGGILDLIISRGGGKLTRFKLDAT